MLMRRKEGFQIRDGRPELGATVDPGGTNFAIFSRHATQVILEFYENFYDIVPMFQYHLDPKYNKTGDVWHIYVEGIGHGTFYGWRVDGPYEPENGHRFNVHKLLMDPYAKAISGTHDFSNERMYGYDKFNKADKDLSFSVLDSAQVTCKSIVIDTEKYDWEGDVRPKIPMEDTIIYEMHVRLFTQHSSSNVKQRGTFQGILEKIHHLKELGITSVELLPIFEFNMNSIENTNPQTGEKLRDIWGYNPIGFFAVTGNYSPAIQLGEQVFDFKDFVKTMHKEGLEVILDVVYNHSGEGNHLGPTISFRGIDNSIYYLLEPYKRYYANYSGTGNTINSNHPVVKQMILDSLRYWVTEMHVDGFRFDLAAILGRDDKGQWIGDLSLLKDIAEDPILAGTKLIAEGWDAAGGYYLGEFPFGWCEWNGKYRDTIRRFIRGDYGMVSDLATRLIGSPDLFGKSGRRPYHSINFVTAHDGFTLWDLVSYNTKHNWMNGEGNRDGTDANYSYNHGVEGNTERQDVLHLRKRQVKNMMAILMVSQGIPMILMGDEFGRTQQGNNNAYCHDNEISWVDWTYKEKHKDIFTFCCKMIDFRKKHSCLKREHFFSDGNPQQADITWHGVRPYKPDWNYYSQSLAFMIRGQGLLEDPEDKDCDIYVILNSYIEPLVFELPKLKNKRWFRVVDTFFDSPYDFLMEPQSVSWEYQVQEKSVAIFISREEKFLA
ncbi:MAG: glycogen debranching protein GlgX [Epulopiscium sp.]|nr:glycogen debranching protein GlgX [Candidatus Epulonipiscium sp.]